MKARNRIRRRGERVHDVDVGMAERDAHPSLLAARDALCQAGARQTLSGAEARFPLRERVGTDRSRRDELLRIETVRAPARGTRTDGEQVLFVESSSSSMLEAAGSRPAGHLAQVRAAERAHFACARSRRTSPSIDPTPSIDLLIGPAPRIFTVSSVSSEDTTSSLHPFFTPPDLRTIQPFSHLTAAACCAVIFWLWDSSHRI